MNSLITLDTEIITTCTKNPDWFVVSAFFFILLIVCWVLMLHYYNKYRKLKGGIKKNVDAKSGMEVSWCLENDNPNRKNQGN